MNTKKDFEATARIIARERAREKEFAVDTPEGEAYAEAWRDACNNFSFTYADLYGADNPRFDRARFLKACGMEGSI